MLHIDQRAFRNHVLHLEILFFVGTILGKEWVRSFVTSYATGSIKPGLPSPSRMPHFTPLTSNSNKGSIWLYRMYRGLCTCEFTKLMLTSSEKCYFYHLSKYFREKVCDASRQNVCNKGNNRTHRTCLILSYPKCVFDVDCRSLVPSVSTGAQIT